MTSLGAPLAFCKKRAGEHHKVGRSTLTMVPSISRDYEGVALGLEAWQELFAEGPVHRLGPLVHIDHCGLDVRERVHIPQSL